MKEELKIKLKELHSKGLNDYQIAKEMKISRCNVSKTRSKLNLPVQERKSILSKQILEECIEKNLSVEEISILYNTSESNVFRVLKQYNLKNVNTLKIEKAKKEWIDYYNQGLNDTEIGIKLNISYSTISIWRNQLNLKPNFEYKTILNDELFLKYYNQNLKDSEISRILEKEENIKIDAKTVGDFRNNLKLPIISPDSFIDNITEEEFQIILGSLFGDGCLSIYKRGVIFTESHTEPQKEYLYWKHKKLNRLVNKINVYKYFDVLAKRELIKYSFKTKHYQFLDSLYPIFYDDKKEISLDCLDLLNDLGLAVWYMDDGCKATNGGYYLCTNGFNYESHLIIKKWFLDKYNIKTSIHNRNIGKNGEQQYILYIHKNKKFQNIIEPYIIETLKYKLHK